VFDIDRFTSFEGDTGPYILYTIVRIKSILAKYKGQGGGFDALAIQEAGGQAEKSLMLQATQFSAAMQSACEETAPNKVCGYIYDLANAFNHLYHETMILGEKDEGRREGLIALLLLVLDILETCIDVLGFSAPERM
jgi:arginyl-tRNA synthetase